jgi:glutaminyl-peptide cyclotransferase
MRFYLIFLLAIASFSCGNSANVNAPPKPPTNTSKPAAVPVYDYQIVNTYPHDPQAFTQGLEFHEGILYESTGGSRESPVQKGNIFSSLRKVDYRTGKVLQKHDVPSDYFGEGITIFNGKIYQLTWREMTAFVYDLDLKLLRELRYSGQGWGLTNNGTHLIMSDGTHVIRFVNPEDFKTVRTIVVNDEQGKPLMELNELELINGEIWANVYQTGWIVRIDPENGKLLGRIDINRLVDAEEDRNVEAKELNGIAYDKTSDRIFITGKLWKSLFEIKVTPR